MKWFGIWIEKWLIWTSISPFLICSEGEGEAHAQWLTAQLSLTLVPDIGQRKDFFIEYYFTSKYQARIGYIRMI